MQTGNNRPETEADKVLMVLESDAVTRPWTVMVHSHHTLLTNAAVMSPWRFKVVALVTMPKVSERSRGIGHVKCFLELLVRIVFKKSRSQP